jgi:hypothetical protein
MRFFTRELWLGAQRSKDEDNHLHWDRAFAQYRAQLETLRPRLIAEAFEFFADADIHDGELLELTIVDGSRPAPWGSPPRPWRLSRDHPARGMLAALDANDAFVWRLSYEGLRRVLIDYPTEAPLFHRDGLGFGDWGYHELTDAGDGFLRHEILFGSGSVLLFEFKEVAIHRTTRPEPADGPWCFSL